MESQIPNYPNLPPQLICQLHNVTMHVSLEPWKHFLLKLSKFSFVFIISVIPLFQADAETDEVYAQMTLQPLNPVNYIFFCLFVSYNMQTPLGIYEE